MIEDKAFGYWKYHSDNFDWNQPPRLELVDKRYTLEFFKDNELAKARSERDEAERKVAVLEQKVEMLDKIVDLDSDILDVKDVVSKLIEKLPTINLDGIAAAAPTKQSK